MLDAQKTFWQQCKLQCKFWQFTSWDTTIYISEGLLEKKYMLESINYDALCTDKKVFRYTRSLEIMDSPEIVRQCRDVTQKAEMHKLMNRTGWKVLGFPFCFHFEKIKMSFVHNNLSAEHCIYLYFSFNEHYIYLTFVFFNNTNKYCSTYYNQFYILISTIHFSLVYQQITWNICGRIS